MSRTTTPSRHCAVEFQALPSRIGQVRRIVSAQLRYWHLHPLIDRAALGMTELLANVHEHAGPDKHCTVELVFLWDRLTVSVRDQDPNLPRLRESGALATDGRGLALVAAVSESWGVHARQDGSGKVVWFTLPAPFTTSRTVRPAAPAASTAAAPSGASAPPAPAAAAAAAAPAAASAPLLADDDGAAAPVEQRPRASHA
ncbi:ATP-binding protein [Streptomyces armeniacus]|uniref:ATP-binding protein n=1 Tax=Streptomyces armeniacus TaxID=83291 RepID=A0A345XZL8_9ACTN|nr:ATP-binding protein [Streptomyces armeniacus]